MLPSHPRIEVIAFHAPFVEAGVVVQPVHTDTGMRDLIIRPEVWAGAVDAISAALKVKVEPAEPKTSKTYAPARTGDRQRLASKRLALYRAVLADVEQGGISQVEACLKHAVKPGAFYVWRARECAAVRALAGGSVVVKPNGKIL